MKCRYKWIGVKLKEMYLLLQQALAPTRQRNKIIEARITSPLYMRAYPGPGYDPERLDWCGQC